MDSLKGHWGHRDNREFLSQIGFDFVAQLDEIVKADGIGRAGLAKKLGVSKGRVSQILNNPGNLTLQNIVKYCRALNRKVTIVAYDDADNESGPIPPQIFVKCWQRANRPSDLHSATAVAAVNRRTHVGPQWVYRRDPRVTAFTASKVADNTRRDNLLVDKPSLEYFDHGRNDTAYLHA